MNLKQGTEHTKNVIEEKTKKAKYAEYLNSDDWQEKRAVALEVDGYRCYNCKTKKNLHVHHMTYGDWYNVNPKTDLVTLCGDCHREVHNGLLRIKKKTVNRARGTVKKSTQKQRRKNSGKFIARPKRETMRKWINENKFKASGSWVVDVEDLRQYLSIR